MTPPNSPSANSPYNLPLSAYQDLPSAHSRVTGLPHSTTNPPNPLATIPPVTAPESERVGWLLQSAARGRAFLASQPAFPFIEMAARILQGFEAEGSGGLDQSTGKPTTRRARIRLNQIKRIVKEVVATMHNMNPEVKYTNNSEDDPFFNDLVDQLNGRWKTWWKGNTFPAARIKEALQHAATAMGYINPIWRDEIFGSNEADIDLKVYGPGDVLPDQITDDWDLQKAYAVHCYERMPTLRLRQLWYQQANRILPNTPALTDNSVRGVGTQPTGVRGWIGQAQSAIGGLLGGNWIDSDKQAGSGAKQLAGKMNVNSFQYTDLYITYVMDGTCNESGQLLYAKQFTDTDEEHLPTTVRDYVVPPMGVEVKINPDSKEPPRMYSYNDCMMYPSRRMIIWTQNSILYDGPSFWHHGQVPLIKVELDPWVWSYMPSSIVEENREAQAGLTSILRGWIDAVNLRLKPPMKVKRGAFSPGVLATKDFRNPGEVVEYDPKYGDDVLSPMVPYQNYDMGDKTIEVAEYIRTFMNHNIGAEDFSSLAKLNQIPDADGIEKLMQAMGPLMSDYAASLEKSMTQLGYQCSWLWMQFDTTARRLRVNGPTGMLDSEVDWQPGNIVPAEIPGASDLDNSSFFRRLRYVARRIGFFITPQSIFNLTDWKRKMVMLQLFREPNFKMDSQTLAEVMGIEGYGTLPGATIIERWVEEQRMTAQFTTDLQIQAMQKQIVAQMVAMVQGQAAQGIAAQQLQGEGAITPEQQLMMAAQQLAGGGEDGEGGGGMAALGAAAGSGRSPGRPSSGQEPPQLINKVNPDGTTRQVISESGS